MASPLWLVDRSRISDGRGFCSRSRLLGYHIGPYGLGIALKATKVPLMTGILGHDGLAPILAWCRDYDPLIVQGFQSIESLNPNEIFLPVPEDVIRDAIQQAHARYWSIVTLRGFAYLAEDESVQAILREQQYLIAGLIWAWCLEVLPQVLLRGKIVEVEEDDTYVFACTCGLGDGVLTQADHEARDCRGIGLMCRPDFVVETRHTQELEYHEFKTTGLDSSTFRDKWEVMIQFFAATLDVERRRQQHVQSVYVHGLIKGKREGADWDSTTRRRTGPLQQQSVFCYGYRRPAVPPMEAEDWQAEYEYFDEFEGKTKRLGNKYQKTGVWEYPDALLPQVTDDKGQPRLDAQGQPVLMSKAEFWTKAMPARARRKNLVLLGPFQRQTQMVQHFLDETAGEEARWQAGLWELYDLGVQILEEKNPPGLLENTAGLWWIHVWPDRRFQAAMDRLFPRSYECRRYGMRHRCQFEGICLEHEGWDRPIETGTYVSRVPHHQDELEQLAERGIVPADAGWIEEEEREL